MPTRWQTLHYQSLLQETWDDETFVFNPSSGHTHVLNSAAAEILKSISKSNLSLDELTTIFFDESIGLSLPKLREALKQQLAQLHTMGLIQKLP